MDQLDKLDKRLDWAIRIGTIVAVLLLVLGYDASYQVRHAPPSKKTVERFQDEISKQSQRERQFIDSLLRYYLAEDDSLKVRK